MPDVTTVKVSTDTRDELKAVAERDGSTLEGALKKLLRAERQREFGQELASRPMTDEDHQWIVSSARAVGRSVAGG